MKTILALLLILPALHSFGQKSGIELIDFEKKIRLNTSELKNNIPLTASSKCQGEVKIEFEDTKFSGGCAGSLERNYHLSDDCGNKLTVQQFISLTDDTPPVFQNLPADTVIAGREQLMTPEYPAAFDEFGEASITFDEVVDFSDSQFVKVTRIWTATDECENTSTHSQVISIPRRTE